MHVFVANACESGILDDVWQYRQSIPLPATWRSWLN